MTSNEKTAGSPARPERIAGCLLGGAVGDALGAPVEFMRLSEIRERFGGEGLTDFAPAYGRLGAITDDTQMTLFTAEGLLRAYCRGIRKGICDGPTVIYYAYVRRLKTQGYELDSEGFRDATGRLSGAHGDSIPTPCGAGRGVLEKALGRSDLMSLYEEQRKASGREGR